MIAAYSVERDPANPAAVVVRAVSMVSGKDSAMTLPLDLDAFVACRRAYHRGALIQDAFPSLNADQREFIKTGITPEEWNAMFPDSDSDGTMCERCASGDACGRCGG
jgi:hypothetical protein